MADVMARPHQLIASDRVVNSKRIFARLKPGVSLEQARAEMATISARLEQEGYIRRFGRQIVLPDVERLADDFDVPD